MSASGVVEGSVDGGEDGNVESKDGRVKDECLGGQMTLLGYTAGDQC